MSDRFTLLRDYCTNFQRYRELRPDPCSIEEEYELRKRIAAADAMAKALEEAIAYINLDIGDYGARVDYADTNAMHAAESALAAYNALR